MGKEGKKHNNPVVVNCNTPKQFVVNEHNKYVLGGYFGLGLSNFYKTVLSVFVKAGIEVKSKKGNIIYDEEKIGEVLRTLHKSTLNPRPAFEDSEKAWSNNFKLNTNQQVQLQKLLFHHFPMLGPIMAGETAYKVKNNTNSSDITHGATLTECLDVISNIAQGLVDCRNANTHFKPYNDKKATEVQNQTQTRLVRYLNHVFVAARRLDKNRNANLKPEDLDFLTGYAQKGEDEAYLRVKGFYPKNIQELVTDENGKTEKDKRGKPKTKMVECKNFFYRVGCEDEVNKKLVLSGFGIVYFCAMFLSKGQIKQMLSDIKLFEVSPYSKEQNGIVRDIICVYRIRTPRGKKLEGSDSKVTLALDILNELRKCPRELFDVLTPEGQKFFEDKVEHVNEHTTDDVVKRFRSMDRFPHLAMKYIDETKLFKNIRFQVQLGRFRFKFYDKECIDGREEIRAFQKEINGFGRLQEIEQERKEKYKEILQSSETRSVKVEGENVCLELLQFDKDTAESAPYITDSRAFYNICNNRIGLYWTEEKHSNGYISIKRGHYCPDLKVDEKGKTLIEMTAHRAMLSVYELPAMLFCQYLLSEKKIDNINLENIIIAKYNNLRQFFTDVSNGSFMPVSEKGELEEKLKVYGLAVNEIPDKLAEYLSSTKLKDHAKRNMELLRGRLALRLQKTMRRKEHYEADRKKIGSKDNKYAKKAYADIRHGALARYLSASFLEWQPTMDDGRDKLTGLNFSKLQSALATFNIPRQFTHIEQMLKAANLLDGGIAHPFLQKVMDEKPNNVEDLYLEYLVAEINHLKSFFNINGNDKNINFETIKLKSNVDISKFPFVKGKARWEQRTVDYYKNLAQRYLKVDGKDAAIWLPDGIFTTTIIDLLKNNYADNKALMECMTNDDLTNNVAYLINKFLELELKDRSQPFYISENKEEKPNRFARVYDLFNILNNKKVKNALLPVPMTSRQINQRFAKQLIKKEVESYIGNMQVGRPDPQKPKWKIEKDAKALAEAKTIMRRRLTHAIHDVKVNERAIRRYKTQDVILFLMAKQLIGEAVAMKNIKESEKFRLATICNSQFLAQTVDFEFPMDVNGQPVYISQREMSLKNYGEFYRLLSDDRLPSLLEKLATAKKMKEGRNTLNYTDVMGELATYDIHRSRIFRAVHQLESAVVSNKDFKIFLDDPSNKKFYINDDETKMAKRNNFRSLLELLENGDVNALAGKERELIISIRNAFSHNHYKVDFESIASKGELAKTTLVHEETEDGKKVKAGELTTIATLIVNRLEELQNKIELK